MEKSCCREVKESHCVFVDPEKAHARLSGEELYEEVRSGRVCEDGAGSIRTARQW